MAEQRLETADRPTTSFVVLLTRLTWMIGGPLVLFLSLMAIGRSRDPGFAAQDVVYFVVLAVMVVCRWLEFRTGESSTATGERMTSGVIIRYGVGVALLGVAAWAGVKTATAWW